MSLGSLKRTANSPWIRFGQSTTCPLDLRCETGAGKEASHG